MNQKESVTIVPYKLSIQKENIRHLASTLTEITGDHFLFENDRLSVPATQGEGGIEFYELGKGVVLVVMNCCFRRKITFKREIAAGAHFFYLALNFSDSGVMFRSAGTDAMTIGKSIFSFSGIGMEVDVPAGNRVKLVILKCTADWLHNNTGLTPEAFSKIVTYTSLQKQLLQSCLPDVRKAIRNNIKKVLGNHSALQQLTRNEDIERLHELKNTIIQKLHDELPKLEDAAKECLMSVSKFSRLFKKIFDNTYAVFFWDIRLEHACRLLENGMAVKEAAISCGYGNLPGFSKAFKLKYKCSPSAYRDKFL